MNVRLPNLVAMAITWTAVAVVAAGPLLMGSPTAALAQDKKPDDKPKEEKAKEPAKPLIPDKKLEAAVRAAVYEKRNNQEPLTEEDLRKVFILEADSQGIKVLTGLDKCTNLLLLKVAGNEIADLGPLAGLVNLQSLDLAGNQIKDVGPLAKLEKLQYLHLADNQVQSVEPLAGLNKLSALYLSNNKIKDISPLAKLEKLASLYLDGNGLEKIDALTSVDRLSTLDISRNAISDLKPLGTQTQLRLLLAQQNKIGDLAPLVALCKADSEGQRRLAPFLRVYLAGNPLSDKAKNEQVKALQGFGTRVMLTDEEQ